MKQLRFSDATVSGSNAGRPSWKLNSMLHLDTLSIVLGAESSWIAGKNETEQPGLEHEDPIIAMDHSYLKLMAQKTMSMKATKTCGKLLILVAKDVKTGTHAATCLQEKDVSEYATQWLVSLLRRLGVSSSCVADGEPSIVALNTATLLAAPCMELVFRESPAGEHATNGVAESAMRDVKRQTQTRTLKFALEAHVGKIVESHFILRRIPTMAPDALSFLRIGSVVG